VRDKAVATTSIPIIVHSILFVRCPNELSVEPTIRDEVVFINSIRAITRLRLSEHFEVYLRLMTAWRSAILVKSSPLFAGNNSPLFGATSRQSNKWARPDFQKQQGDREGHGTQNQTDGPNRIKPPITAMKARPVDMAAMA